MCQITGTTTFNGQPAYTAEEWALQGDGSYAAKVGGRVLGTLNPGVAVVGSFSTGDFALTHPANAAGNAVWEMVPLAAAGSGTFARLTTSGANSSGYGTGWKYVPVAWYDAGGYGWHDVDGASESADYVAFPSTVDGTDAANPVAGLRVRLFPSATLAGCYEFLPEGYADDTHPGLVSITTQTFKGDKTFDGNVTVDDDLTVEGNATVDLDLAVEGNATVSLHGEVDGSLLVSNLNSATANQHTVIEAENVLTDSSPVNGFLFSDALAGALTISNYSGLTGTNLGTYSPLTVSSFPSGTSLGINFGDGGTEGGEAVFASITNTVLTGETSGLTLVAPENGFIVATSPYAVYSFADGKIYIGDTGSFLDQSGTTQVFKGGLWVGPAGYMGVAPEVIAKSHRVTVPEPPPLTLSPKRPIAVVTVAAGESGKALFAETGEHMRRYAEKCGADFVVLDHIPCDEWPISSKFGVWRALERYERIVYADADVLFRPTAVNLFEMCGPHEIGGYDDWPEITGQGSADFVNEFKAFREMMGFIEPGEWKPVPYYLNTGVLVIPKDHLEADNFRHYFRVPDRPIPPWHCAEQHLWVSRLIAANAPVKLLPRVCNWQHWGVGGMDDAPPEAVLHWSGMNGCSTRPSQIRKWAARYPWPV